MGGELQSWAPDPFATTPEAGDLDRSGAGPSSGKRSVSGLALALALVAIAGCGYLLWLHHASTHQPAAPEVPRTAQFDETATRFETRAAELETKAAELEAKVAELEGIRELQRYGNEAIAAGHRSALYKLHEYLKNPKIQALKETAEAEIIRVEFYYVTTRRFRGIPDEMPTEPESDPVTRLTGILLDGGRHWGIRAQAARMLGEMRKDLQAADALAKASHSDPNLYVVQESILAFAKVTGFRPSGVFDNRSVDDWWADNRSNFE